MYTNGFPSYFSSFAATPPQRAHHRQPQRREPRDFVISGVTEKYTMPRADSVTDSKPKAVADAGSGPLCSGTLYNVCVTGARPAGLG